MSVTGPREQNPANDLCKACGLCCTGHLFAWSKLRASELESAAELGLQVLGSEPKQRGFNQPCPVWDGECTIYSSPHYPHYCRLYKCTLLKKLTEQVISLSDALTIIGQTKEKIRELESLLPVSPHRNFRERLVAELESGNSDSTFKYQSRALLLLYKNQFGVKDLVDLSEETDA